MIETTFSHPDKILWSIKRFKNIHTSHSTF
jgi:hypothetical protein